MASCLFSDSNWDDCLFLDETKRLILRKKKTSVENRQRPGWEERRVFISGRATWSVTAKAGGVELGV